MLWHLQDISLDSITLQKWIKLKSGRKSWSLQFNICVTISFFTFDNYVPVRFNTRMLTKTKQTWHLQMKAMMARCFSMPLVALSHRRLLHGWQNIVKVLQDCVLSFTLCAKIMKGRSIMQISWDFLMEVGLKHILNVKQHCHNTNEYCKKYQKLEMRHHKFLIQETPVMKSLKRQQKVQFSFIYYLKQNKKNQILKVFLTKWRYCRMKPFV